MWAAARLTEAYACVSDDRCKIFSA